MGLRINTQGSFGSLKFSLIGRFDESADLGDYKFGDAEKVVFDFSRVELMTSSGVRTWIKWIQGAVRAYPGIQFLLENCPNFIVEQASTVNGFLAENVRISSFSVNYHCKRCDRLERRDYKIKPGEPCSVRGQLAAEDCKEGDCPHAMDMDVVHKKYFYFFHLQGDMVKIS